MLIPINSKTKCAVCGANLANGINKCPECGAPLPNPSMQDIIVLVIILTVLGILFFALAR